MPGGRDFHSGDRGVAYARGLADVLHKPPAPLLAEGLDLHDVLGLARAPALPKGPHAQLSPVAGDPRRSPASCLQASVSFADGETGGCQQGTGSRACEFHDVCGCTSRGVPTRGVPIASPPPWQDVLARDAVGVADDDCLTVFHRRSNRGPWMALSGHRPGGGTAGHYPLWVETDLASRPRCNQATTTKKLGVLHHALPQGPQQASDSRNAAR